MVSEIYPKTEEIERWMLETVNHVSHIEYFLYNLGLGKKDPQRPHDLVGLGNKFEWDVIKGLALQYRNTPQNRPAKIRNQINTAIELHRQQYHHRMWNTNNPCATKDDMLVGAVDTVCALHEDRKYNCGRHFYHEILELDFDEIKKPYIEMIVPEMWKIAPPRLDMINDYRNFRNIGLDDKIYETILDRVMETINMLWTKGYELH